MGVKQFTQLATVSLSATTVSFADTPATAVPSGGSEQITFYAAAGSIVRPSAVLGSIPAVPLGTGVNKTSLYLEIGSLSVMQAVGADNTLVSISNSSVNSASVGGQPAVGEFVDVSRFVADSVTGITWLYTNGSASAQTAGRTYKLVGVQEAIV